MSRPNNKKSRQLNRQSIKNGNYLRPDNNLNTDVFISYSKKDRDFVQRLYRNLQKSKRKSWIDQNDVLPTEEWLKAIRSGIEGADNFIFVISPDSVISSYCNDEIKHAVRYNKRIIPILWRDVNESSLPKDIAALNWIDFRNRDRFNEKFRSLITTLDSDLSYVQEHTRFLKRAIEWNAKGKDNSFLLRGNDLRDAEQWLSKAASNRHPTPLQIEYVISSTKAHKRTRRFILGAVLIALFITTTLAVLYRSQKNQAIDQAHIAHARQLAAQSELIRNQGATLLPTSVLLAIESMKMSSSLEANIALRHGLNILPRNLYSLSLSGHPRAIAYSPDGKYVAITRGQPSRMRADNPDEGIGGPIVWILEAATGKEILQLKHNGNVNALAYSPNEHILATASDDQTARIWDTPNGRELIAFRHDKVVKNVVLSPDGKYLFTLSGEENTKRLWEIRSGAEIKHFKKNGYGGSDALDPSGKYLVSICDKRLYIREGQENELISNYIRTNKIDRTYISGNEKYLATVKDNYEPPFSEPVDHTILIWDIDNGVEIAHIKYSGPFAELIFSPTGKYFIIVGVLDFEHEDFVYETDGAGQVMRLEPEGRVSEVTFSNDEKYLATVVEDGTVRVIDLATRQEAARMISDGNALNCAFSPDARFLITTSDRGVAQVWLSTGGQEIARITDDRGDGHNSWNATFISSDGKYLSTIGSNSMPGKRFDDSFRVWEIPSGNEILSLRKDVNCLNYRLSPDQRYVVTDCYVAPNWGHNSIRVWDMATGTEIGVIENPQTELRGSDLLSHSFIPDALSPDGHYVVADQDFLKSNITPSRPKDWPLIVWNVKEGRVALRLSHPTYAGFAKFSAKGNYLAASGETVRIWEMPTGKEVADLPSSNRHLEFSPTGEFLLTVGEKPPSQMWEIKTGREDKRIDLKNARYPIVFSPDGKYLAAANSDGTTVIWDVPSDQEVARLSHTDGVAPVTFSADSKYLATSEAWALSDEIERETVHHTDVWVVASGREITHIEEKYKRIIHFTPDGKYLIADSDQSLWILPWREEDLIDEACNRLTRNFTLEEWHLYFGDEPYRRTCLNLP
ncbi:MAG TPA: TIR domain-containing protein [Pyrinomonadaceae bacterium]|jgi:WD40 repeat protein